MVLIDTHCHLNDRSAFPEPGAAVDEALEAGVEKMIVVGVDEDSSRYAVELAEHFEPVYAVVGHHPNQASDFQDRSLRVYAELLSHPKVVALGEIGLDYYRDHATPEIQEKCLLAQLELAESLQVPVVFHCRDAYDDLLTILAPRQRIPYLFHCYAGTQEQAFKAQELEAFFGVDGPVTYKKAENLRAVLAGLSPERLVIETDAPWMAPEPFRGKRNKPAWLPYIAQALADTLGITLRECAEQTTRDAYAFFKKLSS
ncbi:MAG: TatD family hydrolase [Fimbriimonadaceae bacterium]|nr:TatD family hydrolase [Fimbriimonadaceae bacterium]QYK56320.1 MAG: TatD family hydrolase [Fimbriimonadaceae bacterium]